MNPQVTPVEPPIALQVADAIRLRIERGELHEGDAVPTIQQISSDWHTSAGTARTALDLLKQQGLISSGRGKPARVRHRPPRVVRSSERHQVEKDLVLASERDRSTLGQAELDMSTKIDHTEFVCRYDQIPAGDDLGPALGIDADAPVLRRVYEVRDPARHTLRMWSVSYIPYELVASNPALLDSANEPWPGGTQHQLYTVGIELAQMTDEVTARMPTTVEAKQWDLEEGVPMLRVRRTSIDTKGRTVEVSDADFPADRTELRFVTPLNPWR